MRLNINDWMEVVKTLKKIQDSASGTEGFGPGNSQTYQLAGKGLDQLMELLKNS